MSSLRKVFGPSEEEVWEQFADEIGAEFLKGGFLGRPKVLAKVREWTITLDAKTVTRGSGETGSTAEHYTRMTAPFINMDGFRFRACRKSLLGGLEVGFLGLGRLIEMQDIETGYPEFDGDFRIMGNYEFKVRALFANERIRELMQSESSILLQIQHPWRLLTGRLPKGVDELYLEMPGLISEVGDLYVDTTTGAARVNPLRVEGLKGVDWQTERELRSLAGGEGRKSLAVERLKALHNLFVETLNQLWHTGSASSTTSARPVDQG
jgi:hypothetical protein